MKCRMPRRAAAMAVVWLATPACGDRSRPAGGMAGAPTEEHAALGASFVSRDSASLRRLLHPAFIVQPPPPDSTRQGEAAITYLLGLASHTEVTESRLEPQALVPEGPFALERGIWFLSDGDLVLRSRYVLRWRATGEGWRVVLWRWGRFR